MKNFILYLFQQFDWVFKLHKYIFPEKWISDEVFCLHCDASFIFDKEKICSTRKSKSEGRVYYSIKCPFCSFSCYKFKDTLIESDYFEEPIMKLLYMADGLFLYQTNDSYIVKDQHDNILKESKTYQTCSHYISRILNSRRAAEREASEKVHQDSNKHPSI